MSAQQTLPAPVEGGEDDEIAVEGREGTSIPGGGGDNASDSDEDLEVIWEEVEPPETAGDVGTAAGGESGTISFHGYISWRFVRGWSEYHPEQQQQRWHWR